MKQVLGREIFTSKSHVNRVHSTKTVKVLVFRESNRDVDGVFNRLGGGGSEDYRLRLP